MDEVETLEETAEDMHRMCLEAAKFLATGAMGDIGIGPQALELAAESLQAGDMDIYGRFDFIYDGRGGPAKMLEYNADTPTGLIEAAVAQWFWLQDVFPEKDQWNGIHEALIRQWKKLQYRTGMSTLHIAHSEAEESGEDWMTAAYMRDVASQAGWTTIGINMSDIGWDPNLNRFVDLDNFMISTMFKLYPWELMMKEPFGHRLLQRAHNPRWVEPAWKMLLSNKALLAALWHLYPDHPNLLPAYLDEPGPAEGVGGQAAARPRRRQHQDPRRRHQPGTARRVRPRRLVLPAVPRRFPISTATTRSSACGWWTANPWAAASANPTAPSPITSAASCPTPLTRPAPLRAPGPLQQGRYRPMSTETTTAGGGTGGPSGAPFPPRDCTPGSWTWATPSCWGWPPPRRSIRWPRRWA